jgi:glycosyltransferase involved in cell wall biosynthesis
MTKLVIQIPCLNESQALPITLAALPETVAGCDQVEVVIVDDGSTDGTADVARLWGVAEVVRFPRHQGLARAFLAGLDASLRRGADVIVNTDADNQYAAADIGRLVAPILSQTADVVIGERPIWRTAHFSWSKKLLQRLGSWLVRRASQTTVPDATSGFRAYSREAALRMHVFGDYTYTLETIIQAGQSRLAVTSVPVQTNGPLRPSRLIRNLPQYLTRSGETIVRAFVTYRPFVTFALPAILLTGIGGALFARFLAVAVLTGHWSGHIQSLILGAVLIGAGLLSASFGLLADLMSVNRKLLEDIHVRVRRLECADPVETPRLEPCEPSLSTERHQANGTLEKGCHAHHD